MEEFPEVRKPAFKLKIDFAALLYIWAHEIKEVFKRGEHPQDE